MSKDNKDWGQVVVFSGIWKEGMSIKSQLIVYLLFLLTLVSSCQTGSGFIPVYSLGDRSSTRVQYHLVHKGDTLYSIAFRYGLDYKLLAHANGISKPYTIFYGQKLKISKASYKRVLVSRKKSKSEKRRQKAVLKSRDKASPRHTLSKSQYPKLKWRWPIDGEVVEGFSLTGKVNKGVDIRGKLGESVRNAADGVVVYAGGGLRGYGKLVIVKHNDHFLSAYGHNRVILVKEGEKVKGGQIVAEIGSSDSNQEILHFEIRKDGKPEDPLIYLPNRLSKRDGKL